jgi:cytochrome o ubiquinol oxidase subunit 1
MLIGIPTGVKIYDWMLTMYRGRVRMTVPMVYAIGFVMLFVIGGSSGILLANPSVDYQTHNTVFLVAHFHNMLIPGTLFGMLAGYTFWFPKAFGFRLNDRWGYRAAFGWIGGFILAFFPLYGLGLLGLPRRSSAFVEPAYMPFTIVALIGALLLLSALVALGVQLWVSVRDRRVDDVLVGDPWDGRGLDWATSAPPPEWNFAVTPVVDDRDAFMKAKETGQAYRPLGTAEPIELPRNRALGPVLGFAGVICSFGLVWYMWWLAISGALLALAAIVAAGFTRHTERTVGEDEILYAHRAWIAAARAAPPVTRTLEQDAANRGHAVPASQESTA